MDRHTAQSDMVQMYLIKSMRLRGTNSPNYMRVMRYFDGRREEEIYRFYNYLMNHDLPLGCSLGELYHLEARYRNIESYKELDLPELKDTIPYSVELLSD